MKRTNHYAFTLTFLFTLLVTMGTSFAAGKNTAAAPKMQTFEVIVLPTPKEEALQKQVTELKAQLKAAEQEKAKSDKAASISATEKEAKLKDAMEQLATAKGEVEKLKLSLKAASEKAVVAVAEAKKADEEKESAKDVYLAVENNGKDVMITNVGKARMATFNGKSVFRVSKADFVGAEKVFSGIAISKTSKNGYVYYVINPQYMKKTEKAATEE